MIRRAILAAFALVLLTAQSPLPGFPPGLFGSREALSGSGAASFQGMLDVVSGAKAAWSLRAASAAARGTKAVNVCNITGGVDVACADFSTDATTGDLTISLIGGLSCGTVTCAVKTIYDQSGATNCGGVACDLTNATVATRPIFTVNCIGSLPCMTFGFSNIFLANATGFGAVAQPFTISNVLERTSVAGYSCYTCDSSGQGLLGDTSANLILLFVGGINNAAATDNVFHAVQAIGDDAGSGDYVSVDGSSTFTANGGSGLASGAIGLGKGNAGAGRDSIVGNITEGAIWGSAFSAGQSSSMNTNQKTYWGY